VEIAGREGWGVVCGKPAPPRLHAGDMGPVNLVVGHELGLRPLLHWLVRERSWVQTRGSVSWRAVDCVGGPFFLEQ
jgi:hypothetical protein